MKKIITKSNIITLRLTKKEDIDFVKELEDNPSNAKYIGNWTPTMHIASLSNKDILHLIIEDINTNNPIGYIIMADIENNNKSIEFKRFVISQKGRGFGREALRLIKDYAFNELNAHRLWLDVRENNLKAQNLYESLGFEKEGLLRECILYNDKFESIYIMSILRSSK